ncbi:MAG: hypothetical protein KBF99_17500 [Leptospiraceae bacterium]|nr:hypothetical protein [Leptospiraceae bacterium]MBP9164979.1 hypothetical protein [Leptospiraceae bacterium]
MNGRFYKTGLAILIILISMVSNCMTTADLHRAFTYEQKYDSKEDYEIMADYAVGIPDTEFEDWLAGVDDPNRVKSGLLLLPRWMIGSYYGIGKGFSEMFIGPVVTITTQNDLECSKVYGLLDSARCLLYKSSGNRILDTLAVVPKLGLGYVLIIPTMFQHWIAPWGAVFFPKVAKTVANRRDEARGETEKLRTINEESSTEEMTAGSIIEKQSKGIKKVGTQISANTPSVPDKNFFEGLFGGFRKKRDDSNIVSESAKTSNETTKTESSDGYFKYQIKSAKLTVKVDGKEQD